MMTMLKVLRCALWGQTFIDKIIAKDFTQVVMLSEQQTVLGMIFDVVKDMRIEGLADKTFVFSVLGKAEKIKLRNAMVNKELVDFASRCNLLGIDYMVVKGQTIGCLYPKPELRQAGDIDFLFPVTLISDLDKDYQLQCSKMTKVFPEVQLPKKMLEHEVAFSRNGVLYELHTRLRGWAKKRNQVIWDGLMEKEWNEHHFVMINGVKVRTLSPTLNAAYVFIHLFFHFIREGVSLRQLCDWTMVLHHYQDDINREALTKILANLGVYDAFCAFGTILTDYLGLPESEFPIPLDGAARKWQKKIMKDIFEGGDFGRLHHHAHNSWQFKMETLRIVVRNSFRYYRLCPLEVGGMVPRLMKANLRMLFKG